MSGKKRSNHRPVRESRRVTCETLEERRLLSTIAWTNRGTAQNDNDGFNSAFGASAATARAVIDAALQSWERVILNFNYPGGGNTYNMTINMAAGGTSNGANAGYSHTNGGKPDTGWMTIGRGGDTTGDGVGDGAGYFLDPTPLDSSEFLGNVTSPYAGYAQGGSAAAGLGDLYEVVLHELGHAMGISSNPTINALATNTGVTDTLNTPASSPASTYWRFDGPSARMLFTSYDSGGQSGGASSANGAQHAAPPGAQVTQNNITYFGADDLMTAFYANSQRRLISWNDAHVLGDAFGYAIADPEQLGTFYNTLLSDGTLVIRNPAGNSNDEVSISRFGSTIFADIDLGADTNGTGPTDAFQTSFISQVQRIRIETGGGDDQISLRGLDEIPVTINGGGGSDLLDIAGDAGDNTLTFTGGTITGSRNTITFYTGLEDIYAHGQGGNDTFNVEGIPALSLSLYGDDGNDQAIWGGTANANLSNVVGGGSLTGGTGIDTMIINDAGYNGPRTYTCSLGYITDRAGSSYGYVAGADLVENVAINGAAGGGTFDAAALFPGVNYTINGGAGGDNAILGGGFNNVSATAQGLLTYNAGGGLDTLTFNDQGGTSNFSVGPDNTSFVGSPGIVYYNSALERIVVNGGASANYFNIDGPNLLAAVEVNAGDGNDTISIAANSLRLSYIGGDVSVDGQGGSDTLFIHNQNGAARNETLSPTSLSDGNHSYGYAGIEALSIDLSNFDETMYIVATAPSTYATVYANDGNDTCYFLTSDLSGSYGVTFYGQGGSDTATLNDRDATGPHTYAIDGSTITRGAFAFGYGGLESMALNASNAADTIGIASGGTPLSIDAGGGNDTINLNDVAGAVTINGGGGLDQVNQNDLVAPIDAFWRTLVTDTQVRRIYRTALPITGPYTPYSAVNYSQIHNYVINSGYYTRFEVYSTPAATNIAVHGPPDGAVFRIGSSSIVSAGNGSVDNVRGLVQFFGSPGASNTLTIDDGSDATGDTVRAVPYLVYNGPGAPFLAAGGSVNYYNITSATLVLGSGADTIFATPSNQNTVNIHGGDPTTSPGDTLNLAFAAANNPVFTPTGTGAGGYTFDNAQPLNYTGIEGTAIDTAPPAVTSQAFLYDAPSPAIEYAFSEDVSSSISTVYLTVTNLTTGQVIPSWQMSMSYNPASNRARFTFPGLPNGTLPDGNYRAVLSQQVTDAFGNWMPQDYTLDFFVLAGDANHDRKVDVIDLGILATNWQSSGADFGKGDFNYDGKVDVIDLGILATNWQVSQPAQRAFSSGRPAVRSA